MLQEIEIDLPIPPSVNAAYTDRQGGRGRVKGARAVQFSHDAQTALYGLPIEIQRHCSMVNKIKNDLLSEYIRNNMGGNVKNINPKLAVMYQAWAMPVALRPSYYVECEIFFKDNSRPRDIVNFEKLATDFLVDAGFIIDDCLVDVFTIRRGPVDAKNPRIHYKVKNLKEK